VKDFLADGRSDEIHLERFPAYAPELNPDEGVWQHLKHSPATFFIEPTLTSEDIL
jgi:transposase